MALTGGAIPHHLRDPWHGQARPCRARCRPKGCLSL